MSAHGRRLSGPTRSRPAAGRWAAILLAATLLAGACGGAPSSSEGRGTEAPPTTTGTGPSALAAADAAPARAGGTVRVLLAGDSVMQSLAPALKAALGNGRGADVRFILTPVLAGDPTLKLNWDAQLPAFHPEVIVFVVAIWESVKSMLAGYEMQGPDESWRPRYRAERLDPWVRFATSYGARALFIGSAPVKEPGLNSRLVAYEPELRALPERFGQVRYLSAAMPLNGTPGPEFHDSVVGEDGVLVRTRQTDGTHPCPAGAERLAAAVAAALAAEVPTRPGWETGPWREDTVAFPPGRCPPP